MITKLIASGIQKLGRQGLARAVFWPGLRMTFSDTRNIEVSKTGKISQGERLSQNESATRLLFIFKDNLERNQGDDAITYHVARLFNVVENLESKTAEQLSIYSRMPAFKEFQRKVNEKLNSFNERGKFN
jgi:hypothetical protein